MSPNPGEPEHELRGWTHAICDPCFAEHAPARGWADEPRRVIDPENGGQPVSEPCCYCGQPTRGIFVRQRATEVHRGPVPA